MRISGFQKEPTRILKSVSPSNWPKNKQSPNTGLCITRTQAYALEDPMDATYLVLTPGGSTMTLPPIGTLAKRV